MPGPKKKNSIPDGATVQGGVSPPSPACPYIVPPGVAWWMCAPPSWFSLFRLMDIPSFCPRNSTWLCIPILYWCIFLWPCLISHTFCCILCEHSNKRLFTFFHEQVPFAWHLFFGEVFLCHGSILTVPTWSQLWGIGWCCGVGHSAQWQFVQHSPSTVGRPTTVFVFWEHHIKFFLFNLMRFTFIGSQAITRFFLLAVCIFFFIPNAPSFNTREVISAY